MAYNINTVSALGKMYCTMHMDVKKNIMWCFLLLSQMCFLSPLRDVDERTLPGHFITYLVSSCHRGVSIVTWKGYVFRMTESEPWSD